MADSIDIPKSRLDNPPAKVSFPKWALFLVVFGSLLIVGGAIFSEFLFGEKLLLYKDVGADSVNDTYPTFVHLSDYLRKQGLPSWSFCFGMGQSLFHLMGDLILEPIVWLPRQWIAFSLIFQHLAKAIVSGLLFFRFLRLRDVNFVGSLGGALCLAFSVHMTMGSCWIISQDETLCFTFLLFAAEEAIVCRRWAYLPIAVAFCGLITVFHLYLSAVLLCLFVPIRLIEMYGWRPRVLLISSIRLALLALLGVGLGSIVFLGSSYVVFHTPRASGTIANFAFGPTPHPFQFGSSLYYMTALLRPFSNDMIGTGDNYRGWENYYEGPQIYCGLVSLLLLPVAFSGATRRQRILFGVALGLVVIPTVFPWFRHLFWLFQGGYFRAFSLFSVFVLLILSSTALSRYSERCRMNFWVLGVTLVLLLGVLHCPFLKIHALLDSTLAWEATLFLITYVVALAGGYFLKRPVIAAWTILAVTALELIHFDRITVNRPTITKPEWEKRIGYNDETVDAVRDIQATDKSFFRITKPWGSVNSDGIGHNDPMVFGFYGTSAYASYNNLNYINFLAALDVLDPADLARQAQWSPGLNRRPLLSTFAGEKYIIALNPVPFQTPAYELVRQYGDVYLFKNTFFLPLGLVLNDAIAEDAFFALSKEDNQLALLYAAVISRDGISQAHQLSILSAQELDRRMRDSSLADVLMFRKQNGLRMDSFDQTHIRGSVRLDRPGILVFQMPYDRGWHCWVDGSQISPIKIDFGLLGIVLDRGDHRVELSYRPPLLFAGATLTAICLSLFLFGLWRGWQIEPVCQDEREKG